MRGFDNARRFDFAGLLGRFLSSSYAPLPGRIAYEEAVAQLHALFAQHQADGYVNFVYSTTTYYGRLA